jgi:hypothetical protein
MQQTLKNAFAGRCAKASRATANERCKAVFLDILEGGLNYPGKPAPIFMIFWWMEMMNRRYPGPSMILLKSGWLTENRGLFTDDELYMACVQIRTRPDACPISELFGEKYGLNLNDPKTITICLPVGDRFTG